MPLSPTLSVVLPVHNVDRYLPDMLASIAHNVGDDLPADQVQVIVIDDGSDDDTPAVIESFRRRVPWLQVLRHERAVGLADARNAGLDVAEGRFVTFLDGDDWLAPDYLPQLVHTIRTLGCDFVRVDHVQVRGRVRVTHRAPEARRGVVLDPRSGILPAARQTMVDYPYAWAGIYRRELGDLLRFPGHLHTAEDRPWIWRLHCEADSYAVASLAGLFYRRLVTTSLTQIGDERQLHFLDAFGMVFDYLERAAVDVDPAFADKATRQFLAVLAHHIRTKARFSAAVRRTLHERATAALAALPEERVASLLPSDDRAQELRPVLPPAVRRTVPPARRALLGRAAS